jgi:hypothetical protein
MGDKMAAEERYGKQSSLGRAGIISGWICDNRFADSRGRPASLYFDRGHPSFIELVEAFGNDTTPKEILDDLLHVGTVVIEKDGLIRLTQRS